MSNKVIHANHINRVSREDSFSIIQGFKYYEMPTCVTYEWELSKILLPNKKEKNHLKTF